MKIIKKTDQEEKVFPKCLTTNPFPALPCNKPNIPDGFVSNAGNVIAVGREVT